VYPSTQVFGDQDKLWSVKSFSGLHLMIDNYIPYAAMFRRTLWDEAGGFSADLKKGYEDWDFWMTAVENGWKGFHLPRPLFWYRKHGQSMLSASNLERRATKRLLRHRHRRLYSLPRVTAMLVAERLPLARLVAAAAKEGVWRWWALRGQRTRPERTR
jgi:hypothetical protein